MLAEEALKPPALMLCAALLALAGVRCGGEATSATTSSPATPQSASVTTSTTSPTTTVRPPDLGCDVVTMCVGQYVSLVLRACEASRVHLSAKDETARTKLEVLNRDGISPDEEPEALELFGQLSGSCL
jgi:hypothetical protein